MLATCEKNETCFFHISENFNNFQKSEYSECSKKSDDEECLEYERSILKKRDEKPGPPIRKD